MEKLIISYAHEWVQAMPLSDKMLVCMRCQHRAPMTASNDGVRCKGEAVSPSSGWKGEIREVDSMRGQHEH